jgi:O-antigen ligase
MNFAQRLGTTGLIVVTTIAAMFTVLVAGGSGTLGLQPVRVLYLAMAALSLIPWLAIGIIKPNWRPKSRLLPALLVCIAVVAISTVTSRVPRLSLEMLGDIWLLVEVYLLLVALMRLPQIRLHFQRLALVLCVLVGVLYLVQVFFAWQTWWSLVGHLAIPPLRPGYIGLTLSPNPIATLVLTFGSFGLAAAVLGRITGPLTMVTVGLLVAVVTLITGSRGAWLGAGLGVLAVGATAFALQADVRERARQLLRSRLAIAGLAMAIALVAVGGLLAALSGRLTLVDPGYRAGFTRASLQMFDSSPLTGVGPGVWPTLRAANTLPTDPDLYIPHAHSVYFQTLAEFGLLGILAGAILVGALAALFLRSVRTGDPMRQRVAYAGLFGVVLLAGQQFADMLMNVPAVLLAVVLPIAWLDTQSFDDAVRRPWRKAVGPFARALPLAAGAITIVILVGLARIESTAGIASDGVDAANEGEWQLAAQLSSQALIQDPDLNLYRFQAGVAEANAGDLMAAARDLEAAAMADDYRYAWLDLAAVRWQAGDTSGASDALDRAERLGLQRAPVAVAAGWLRLQLGDDNRAITDFAAGLSLLPSLADDPFWNSASGPPGGIQRVVAAFPVDTDPAVKLQVHLIVRDMASAAEDLRILSPSDPELYAALLAAWQGDATAWATMQSLASMRPLDGTVVSWCRFVAMYRGDHALSDDYGTWVAITGSPNAASPSVGRLSFGAIRDTPSYVLDDYGTLYRRQNLSAQVTAPLPQLVLQDHP